MVGKQDIGPAGPFQDSVGCATLTFDHGGIVALRLLPGRDPREKVYLAVKQITSAPSHTAHSPRPNFRE